MWGPGSPLEGANSGKNLPQGREEITKLSVRFFMFIGFSLIWTGALDAQVTVYSADGLHDGDTSWYGTVFNEFTQATGIEVQYIEGGSGVVVNRVLAERYSPQADVLATPPPFIQKAAAEGRARSLSLDLYDQWYTMEKEGGKWRFTSPTHVVRAFTQALQELDDEDGVAARNARYRGNHFELLRGMDALKFRCLLKEDRQSPIITSFLDRPAPGYSFPRFYAKLKEKGFVIYPGKVSRASTFRIGTIGDINLKTIRSLVDAIEDCMSWRSS